jgi:hypothetical protein
MYRSTSGIFNWFPDYESAALKFEQAGNIYKIAKLYEKASQSYECAANLFLKVEK